ncbi:Ig-like domain-containing protein [Flavobacterium procerum]|uniref:Ig-like domain-containing protein n=1 Tax=Flavobacterium procerum TaxID=1455569 RepID=UPI0035E5BCAA
MISPPLKYEPLITPSTVSKFIKIQIRDTLQPNTTYSMNFGQSITDNNEGNALNQFKYIFSTGSHIDSLTLNGKIKDAYEKHVDNFVSVMLYEINDKYNDSVIYKEFPRYITNTLDSMRTFKFENLKAGKYLLLALKDKGSNNKFNPKDDKIGFLKSYVTVPSDSVYELELFKEKLPVKVFKPIQASGNRLLLPYDGKQNFKTNAPKIVLKNNNEVLETIITQFPKKDSLQIWHKPLKTDSLSIEIEKEKYKKQFTFKFKDQKKDTLNITAVQNGVINFRERFTLESATPLVKFDKSKIRLVNKDSSAVDFTTEYDVFDQKLYVDFKKRNRKEKKTKNFNNFSQVALDRIFLKKNQKMILIGIKFKPLREIISDYGKI